MNRILLTIFVGLMGFSSLWGRHIIGGEMTYKNIGVGRYQFEMRMYRDCYCSDCAEFDDIAFVAVYRCDGSCAGQNQNSAYLNRECPN